MRCTNGVGKGMLKRKVEEIVSFKLLLVLHHYLKQQHTKYGWCLCISLSGASL